MQDRPLPKQEHERAPGLKENKRAARMNSISKLVEPKEGGVRPRELSRGSKEARERMRLRARSEAAKLDILAKRRTGNTISVHGVEQEIE